MWSFLFFPSPGIGSEDWRLRLAPRFYRTCNIDNKDRPLPMSI